MLQVFITQTWGNFNVSLGARPTPGFRDEHVTLSRESQDEASCLVSRRLSVKPAHVQVSWRRWPASHL